MSKKLYEYGAMEEIEGRAGVHLELSTRADETIRVVRARTGMKKKELVSRVIEAFAVLPPEVQDLFLKPLDDPRRSRIAAEMLRTLAGEPSEGPEPMSKAELAELADLLAERVATRVKDALHKKGRKGA